MGYGHSKAKDVMASQRGRFQIDDTALTRIWSAHGLGSVRTTDWAGKGVNNPALVINDACVVRFDGLINEGVSRFHGEQIAYGLLRGEAAWPGDALKMKTASYFCLELPQQLNLY